MITVKIEEVASKYKNKKHGTVVDRVYCHMQKHSDEVYRYDDEDLHNAFPDVKIESINYALWRLEKDGKIRKLKIAPKIAYFGSKEAIERLRKALQQRIAQL